MNDFMGNATDSDRVMHYNIILPNKQLFIIGGGNYWFGEGVHHPVLLTPQKNGGYDSGVFVAPNLESRLYHNTAILLADATVFFMGGNPNRAVQQPHVPLGTENDDGQKKHNPDSVTRDVFFLQGSIFGKGARKPTPAESWTADIYKPPYLFIDPGRRTNITGLSLVAEPLEDGFVFSETIAQKTHYLLHSNMTIEMELDKLPKKTQCVNGEKGSLVLLKLGSVTHGWDNGQQIFDVPIASIDYASGLLQFDAPNAAAKQIFPAFYHLFYVDCMGKPAKAASVRFDDNVLTLRARAAAP